MVPVVDMGLLFGLQPAENPSELPVMIIELEHGSETMVIGAVADSIREVIELGNHELEDPYGKATQWRKEYIRGISRHHHEAVMVLDFNRIFCTEELIRIDTAAAKASALEW